MEKIQLGYACINTALNQPEKEGRKIIRERITTNRSMIKKTFKERGLPYASELALKNCYDLEKIIKWNKQNGINFFRISSDLFPWASEYNLEDLPDYEKICKSLRNSGEMANKYSQRLTFHPGPFNKLASPKEDVVISTIKNLEHHGEVMDLMGLSRTPYNKINIHVGGAYGDKVQAMERFCKNFQRLSPAVARRLTVENDDIESLYSVSDLWTGIYLNIKIPIVFDYHHHKFCSGGLSEQAALRHAFSTWPDTIRPVVHYSQSRAEEQNNPKIRANAHSDSYWEPFEDYNYGLDVMLECKSKEQGLFKMRSLLKEREQREVKNSAGSLVKLNKKALTDLEIYAESDMFISLGWHDSKNRLFKIKSLRTKNELFLAPWQINIVSPIEAL